MYYIFVYLASNMLKQIKTVSELEKNPGQGQREKIHVVPLSPHFPAGDATDDDDKNKLIIIIKCSF